MGHTPVPFTFYLATATTATAAATDSLPTVVSLSTLRLYMSFFVAVGGL